MHRAYEWLKTPRYAYGRLLKLAFTYKWLGQPLFWSLKYGQLCTRDGGCRPGVTLPVNTNARIDYETLRSQLASGERSLHPETAQVT